MKIVIDGKREDSGEDEKRGDQSLLPVQEISELGDSLRQLNDDSVDPKSNMTAIDMKSRLAALQINGLIAIDALVAFNFLSTECEVFSRKAKRLWVSREGLGREELTRMVIGQRDHVENSSSGIGSKFKRMMGMK